MSILTAWGGPAGKDTPSPQVMEFGLLGDEKAVGQLLIEGDRAQVIGEQPLAFERAMILTIPSGAPSEINRWSGKVSLTNEASGRHNHHAVMSFETEITSLPDFDVTFVWDRTENPQTGADGVVPDQDDFRMVVAIGIEF